ncbi:MAG: TetR/AcrR family transcriptional regulator [Polyangiaceae bacterium]|nr:TetR/AcrR family transcriptional regulator [Polyangiaceae bacterium]
MATSRRRARPEARSTPPEERGTAVEQREPRGARRKRETREKLLRAAFQLIAERGVDAVAVNEITEAADVGFGSFYNHFESKDAIHAAVLGAVFDDFGDALEKLTANIDDPAEIIAVSVRHVIGHARREPLWGRFLLREWYRPEAFPRGLGARLLHDIGKGIARKRFEVTDPLMTTLVAGGTVIGALAAQLGSAGEGGAKLLDQFGMTTENLDQRAAAALLQGFGLPALEAKAIAKRPLPTLEWAPVFGGTSDD